MSLLISKVFTYDVDAGNYIQAVEAADAQALEPATRQAINNFVIGCKQDGIWTAIKASCILAGARTLAGALVPLAGTAPTNFNFVSGDYNRKTGLVGDGSTKYLNSNRNGSLDPAGNDHLAIYKSSNNTTGNFLIGANNGPGRQIQSLSSVGFYDCSRSVIVSVNGIGIGFMGYSNNATQLSARALGSTNTNAAAIFGSENSDIFVFTRNIGGVNSGATGARLSYYSIGESLDLALLDARVTALINAFAAAIP